MFRWAIAFMRKGLGMRARMLVARRRNGSGKEEAVGRGRGMKTYLARLTHVRSDLRHLVVMLIRCERKSASCISQLFM
jgi:hypothetical protein